MLAVQYIMSRLGRADIFAAACIVLAAFVQ